MKDQKKAEAVASERVQLLSPLLAEGIDLPRLENSKRGFVSRQGSPSGRFAGTWPSIVKRDSRG